MQASPDPPLRGIALPEKRIHIFVLAAQRIGYLTNGGRYGLTSPSRTAARGYSAHRIRLAPAPRTRQRPARHYSTSRRSSPVLDRAQRLRLAIGEERHPDPAPGQQ